MAASQPRLCALGLIQRSSHGCTASLLLLVLCCTEEDEGSPYLTPTVIRCQGRCLRLSWYYVVEVISSNVGHSLVHSISNLVPTMRARYFSPSCPFQRSKQVANLHPSRSAHSNGHALLSLQKLLADPTFTHRHQQVAVLFPNLGHWH